MTDKINSGRPKNRFDLFFDGLRERNDGFGYGVFLLAIFGFVYVIGDDAGWPMSIFCGLLLIVILELSYRLSNR